MPQQISSARKWFLLTLGLSGLFLIYTAVYATGVLDVSTLSVEHWLLNRPIGGLDCVFFEWRHVGDVTASLFLVLALSIVCWRAGYSWKAIPVMLVLFLFCVSVEYIGKEVFALSLAPRLVSGMEGLACPQMQKEPTSVRLETMAGLWWKIPNPVGGQVSFVHEVAQRSLASLPVYPLEKERTYPGGHAARWCFLCLIAAWLCWKHVRYRVGHMTLTILFLLASFFGGFMQFYIGAHFITDTIAGYLLGAAAACCAIGFLIQYDTEVRNASILRDLPLII